MLKPCQLNLLKLSDNPAKLLISYVPWTKAELRATVKDFPKVTEDPHRFVEEFNIITQNYQPGLSNLYQFVYCLLEKVKPSTG